MDPNDDAPPPAAPKSLSDYLKDRDFGKQLMDEIIDSSGRLAEKKPSSNQDQPGEED